MVPLSRTVKGEPRGMLRLIVPLISKGPLATVKRSPRLCGVLSILPSPSLTGAPLLALASGGLLSHAPHSHHCQNPSTSSKTNPHASLIPHLVFIFLTVLTIFYSSPSKIWFCSLLYLSCTRTVPG